MKKISLKQQMLIAITAIAAFGVMVGFLIILPTFQNIRELQKTIADTQKYLEEQYEKTQKMKKSVHTLDTITEQIAAYEKAIVRSGDELKIITRLEALAAASGIAQTLKVSLGDESEKKPPSVENKIPPILRGKSYFIFSFESVGSFENLVKYIKAMEVTPYYFNIDSLQFSKNKDNNLVSLRFTGQVYIID